MIIWDFIKWRMKQRELERTQAPYVPEYAQPDLERIKDPDPSKIQLTWVGHSTFLIQVAGMNLLTDPIWSERASPVSWAGPARHARPGIRFEDLPKIDAVLLSHTHYDHLDRPTVLQLGGAPRYFVPERVGAWFKNEGIENVVELPWWESVAFGPLTIHMVPAKHWSKRWAYGTEDMGWGGFIVESPAGVIYFAGDTGYHDTYFKEIGQRFSQIDLALIPIGAYYPQQIFGRYHVDPREALLVHTEIGATRSIGMHWGTFKLTQEPLHEPPELLAKERVGLGLAADAFSTMKFGETNVF
ncbi:MAG TPA: MBL fold metallo-hydrolase [Candidatus Paceibacterota bacterium]|nr:MBL fold metallo-hydrolase [Candidatus Paceibacterota bacterium]